jgi:hypothetical protein
MKRTAVHRTYAEATRDLEGKSWTTRANNAALDPFEADGNNAAARIRRKKTVPSPKRAIARSSQRRLYPAAQPMV